MSGHTDEAQRKDANSALMRELNVWRHNRKLYPGWLIAPSQTRGRIWHRTKDWLDAAINASNTWPAPQALILWRELSWRLDLSLQVLPLEVIHRMQTVVDDLCEKASSANFSIKDLFPRDGDWPEKLTPNAQEFRDDSICCQLALLDGYRLAPNSEAFDQVLQSLLANTHLTTDHLCFVQYQSCLRALSELGRDQVNEFLAAWPENPGDPYWQVRKAAIILELGDHDNAYATAIAALEHIRLMRRSDETDFWALSREGWCLQFLYQMSVSGRYSKNEVTKAQDKEIEKQHDQLDRGLEIARCSPETELSLIKSRLENRPPPIPRQSIRKTPPDFDHGFTGEVHWFGEDCDIDRLASAINLLKLIDCSGLPPRVDNTVFFNDQGKRALSWIRKERPGLWAAFALRFDGIGIGDEPDGQKHDKQDAIRRGTLETLPLIHIERLFSAAIGELERITCLFEDSTAATSLKSPIWSVKKYADLATRFSMCLGERDRERVLICALRLSRLKDVNRNHIGMDAVISLVERIVPYLSAEQLRKWFVDLLFRFPLDSDEIDTHRQWPEIAAHVRFSDERPISRGESDEFATGVDGLISALSTSDLKRRTDAALRLLRCNDWGLLHDEEIEKFSEALWENKDEVGLPKLSPSILRRVHLEWPGGTLERAIKGLTTWILGQEVKNRYGDADGVDSKGNPRYSVSSRDPDKFLSEVRYLARHCESQPDLFLRLFNEKTQSHILSAILSWWKRERAVFRSKTEASGIFTVDTFDRIRSALLAIFCCALGGQGLQPQLRNELTAFLDEVDEICSPMSLIFPIRAFLDNDQQPEYWEMLRRALSNPNPNIAYSALHACWVWHIAATRLVMQPMPEHVFARISIAIETLAEDTSLDACDFVGDLISRGCFPASDYDLHRFAGSLESTAMKLAYTEARGAIDLNTTIDLDLHSQFRSRLAQILLGLMKQNVPMGPIAAKWFERARTDRFVDVRMATVGANLS